MKILNVLCFFICLQFK